MVMHEGLPLTARGTHTLRVARTRPTFQPLKVPSSALSAVAMPTSG